ncbi:MAG: hypothetical protein LBI48_00635 [Burkholderiaceae bacterium]|jgi:hypothetical protein|nr:hypothetical protein [Burkholderiaceae bacterium]
MSVTIHTAQAHAVRVLGDFTLMLTWVNGERAIVLLPTHRRRAPWFVVCESAAWRYADDPRYLARQSVKACEVLDMPGQAARIGGLIFDHLTDLRRMPPEPPPGQGVLLGEAVVRAGGQMAGGHEVRCEPQSGITFGA